MTAAEHLGGGLYARLEADPPHWCDTPLAAFDRIGLQQRQAFAMRA